MRRQKLFQQESGLHNLDDVLTLDHIHQGERARVKALNSTGSMRRRLLDIGLVEGTRVECLQRSPAGDPIAYLIRGAVIALRTEDSSHILVEYC